MSGLRVDIPKETVVAWIKGDMSAFGRIVKLTMKEAFSVALSFVGDVDDARDISQDAYILAHKSRKRFDPSRPFFPWFYAIIRNLCLNFLKRRGTVESPSSDVLEVRPSSDPSPEQMAIRNENREMVWKALFKLTPEHREVVILRDIVGLSYEEIAEVAGIPVGTVMSRLYYAREKLYRLLKGLEQQAW